MRRLIVFILFFALFLTFIVFNLGNKSDISFGFKTFPDVPVYLSIFISMGFGMLVALLFTLYGGRKKDTSSQNQTDKPFKKPGKRTKNTVEAGKIQGQSGPYGID